MALRSSEGDPTDKFPLLIKNGLVIHKTLSDGNCLFRALSDQLYGDFERHLEVRRNVVGYMRAHPDDFKLFIPAGSIKKNPRRRVAAAGHIDNNAAADAELERCFQNRLEKMSRPCEWGDHVELAAFAKAYKVDVTVWHNVYKTSQPAEDGKSAKRHLHLAFDEPCSHWSSVRNVNGSSSGLPAINYGEEAKVDVAIAAKSLEINPRGDSFERSVSDSSSSSSATSRNKRRRDSGGDREGRPRGVKRRHGKLAKKMS
ncbi:a0f93c4e-8b56-4bcd-8d4a-7867cbbd8793-CDS [Sclerotinia trifoliorum]|uniref:A0f93c4e-8b56-4bcd-8d4a-7867cbbd8793-CDS n=1 Tax=Sclerotinia trifoliorum TaxID=28548 RepID=A0A8H2W2Q6_9HELO|nr:a0f93c4e-8b56-4bcd-8d4a-7867cbbd8793-CDS [Sclerotinia trifoliorum]